MSFDVHEYSNKTKYGYGSDEERYRTVGLLALVPLSSLLGDTIILIASIRYDAFKLHKVIVVIIQHIAVCDLIATVIIVLPALVNILADRWIFGNFFCNLKPYISIYTNTAGIFLIYIMTVSKVVLLKYPLRFGSTSHKKSHMLCGLCWLTAVIMPISMLLLDVGDVHFSYRSYECDYAYSAKA